MPAFSPPPDLPVTTPSPTASPAPAASALPQQQARARAAALRGSSGAPRQGGGGGDHGGSGGAGGAGGGAPSRGTPLTILAAAGLATLVTLTLVNAYAHGLAGPLPAPSWRGGAAPGAAWRAGGGGVDSGGAGGGGTRLLAALPPGGVATIRDGGGGGGSGNGSGGGGDGGGAELGGPGSGTGAPPWSSGAGAAGGFVGVGRFDGAPPRPFKHPFPGPEYRLYSLPAKDDSPRCRQSGICDGDRSCGPDKLGCVASARARQQKVREAIKWSWQGYRKYAWGSDEVNVLGRAPMPWFRLGLTIVDGIDTLMIAGLEEEYREARHWIANQLHFPDDSQVQVSRGVGGGGRRGLGKVVVCCVQTSAQCGAGRRVEAGVQLNTPHQHTQLQHHINPTTQPKTTTTSANATTNQKNSSSRSTSASWAACSRRTTYQAATSSS